MGPGGQPRTRSDGAGGVLLGIVLRGGINEGDPGREWLAENPVAIYTSESV